MFDYTFLQKRQKTREILKKFAEKLLEKRNKEKKC